MSEKRSILKDKSFAFALRTIKLYQYLSHDKKEFVLSKQILRNGTSLGAMVREAQNAECKLILFISWLLPKKNVMKQFTGSSF